jgi:amidase
MSSVSSDHKTLAAEKKLQRSNRIPKAWLIPLAEYESIANLLDVPVICGVLNDIERDITSNYDATALLEKIRARIWSIEQVTVAFCKRAAIAQQLVNPSMFKITIDLNF